jgi:hypothetical protein
LALAAGELDHCVEGNVFGRRVHVEEAFDLKPQHVLCPGSGLQLPQFDSLQAGLKRGQSLLDNAHKALAVAR